MLSKIHIFGPLYVQTYGLSIAIGIVLAVAGAYYQKEKSGVPHLEEHLWPFIVWVGAGAILGGRLLFCLLEGDFSEWYALWQGGFCILGSLAIGSLAALAYAKHYHLSLLPVLDCAALYIPLIQAVSRVGCFLAGCCGGTRIDSTSILFTQIPLAFHPTQLYSALCFLLIFLGLQLYKKYKPVAGSLALVYLGLAFFERGMNDFWRFERGKLYDGFSIQQWGAFGVSIMMLAAWLILITHSRRKIKFS